MSLMWYYKFMRQKFCGNKLRELRKSKKISSQNLAAMMYKQSGEFITPQSILSWERGVTEPGYTSVAIIAQVLGVDIRFFLGKNNTNLG